MSAVSSLRTQAPRVSPVGSCWRSSSRWPPSSTHRPISTSPLLTPSTRYISTASNILPKLPEFYAFQCFLFHLSLHNIIGAQQQHGLRGGGLDQSRSPTNGGGHRLYQQQLGAWVLKERPIHLVAGLSFSLSRLFAHLSSQHPGPSSIGQFWHMVYQVPTVQST